MAATGKVRHVVIYVDNSDNDKSKSSPVQIPPSPSGHCEVLDARKATAGVKAGVGVLLALNALYFCAALLFSQDCHSICLLIDSYQSFFITASLFIHMLDFKLPTAGRLPVLHGMYFRVTQIPASAHGGSSPRQTFSWGRVRLLGQVSNMVFLLSLMFSQLVEAVQTMVHTSHLDALHKPVYVLAFGLTKVSLSLLTFIVLRTTKVHQLSQSPHVLLLERRPRINSDGSFSSRTMRFRRLSGRSVTDMGNADKEHTLSIENTNQLHGAKNNKLNVEHVRSDTATPTFTGLATFEPLDNKVVAHATHQPVELEALLSPSNYFDADKIAVPRGVPNTPPSTVTSEDVQPAVAIKADDNTTTDDTASFSTIVNITQSPTTPNRIVGSNTLGIIESLPPPAPPRVNAALYDGTNASDVVVQRHHGNAAAVSYAVNTERKPDYGVDGDVLPSNASDFAPDGFSELSKNPYTRRQSLHEADHEQEKEPPMPQTRKFCSNYVFDSLYVALNKWLNFISPLAVIASAAAVLCWQPDVYQHVKLADPIIALALIAAIGMAIVPSAMELIYHLLLTVPKDIFAAGGVQRLRECVREQYPRILDIHSLRVWRHDPYNPASIVFTCHIVLEQPSHYSPAFADELQRFIASLLGAYRATCMTIQPEFYPMPRRLVVAQNKRYPCQSVCCEQSVRVRPKPRRQRAVCKQRSHSGTDVERNGGAVSGSDNEHPNGIQQQTVLLQPSPQQNRQQSIVSSSPRGRTKSGSSKLSTSAAPTLETTDLEVAPLFSYSTYFRNETDATVAGQKPNDSAAKT